LSLVKTNFLSANCSVSWLIGLGFLVSLSSIVPRLDCLIASRGNEPSRHLHSFIISTRSSHSLLEGRITQNQDKPFFGSGQSRHGNCNQTEIPFPYLSVRSVVAKWLPCHSRALSPLFPQSSFLCPHLSSRSWGLVSLCAWRCPSCMSAAQSPGCSEQRPTIDCPALWGGRPVGKGSPAAGVRQRESPEVASAGRDFERWLFFLLTERF